MTETVITSDLTDIIGNLKSFKDNPVDFGTDFLSIDYSKKQKEFLWNTADNNQRHHLAIWSRQSGKSTVIASTIVHKLLYGEGVTVHGKKIPETIMVLAPILDQVRNLYDKILGIIEENEIISSFIVKKNMDRIIAINGNKIIFRSASPGSHIRGFTATMIVIDETQDVTDSKYTADILPMGATTNALIIEAGTPMSKNHFWRAMEQAKKPGSSITLSVQKWFECPFLSEEYVMNQKAVSPEALWRQEYLCEFAEEGVLAFPSKLFEPSKTGQWTIADYTFLISTNEISDDVKKECAQMRADGWSFYIGLDLGRSRDYTVITILKVFDGKARIFAHERVPLNTSYTEIATRMEKWYELVQPNEFNFDYTNEKGFADILRERNVPIILDKKSPRGAIIFTTKSKMDMVTTATMLLENYRIQLPRIKSAETKLEKDKQALAESLLQQFLNQQFEVSEVSERVKLYYHPSNENDDQLWSFLLACKNLNIAAAKANENTDFHNPWENEVNRSDEKGQDIKVSKSNFHRQVYTPAEMRRDEGVHL